MDPNGSSWMEAEEDGRESSVAELVLQLGVASRVLSKADVRVVERLCEVGKAYFSQRARALVSAARTAPLLVSYGGDGTPLSTKERFSGRVAGQVVLRRGGSSQEYYVEKVFLAYKDTNGQEHATVVFRDPVPLAAKDGWSLFACGQRLIPTARQLGHQGICVVHYVFDRAMQSTLEARFRGYHAWQYRNGSILAGGHLPLSLLEKLEWIVSTGCSCHDVHNSQKWGAFESYKDENLMTDLWVASSSGHMQRCLGSGRGRQGKEGGVWPASEGSVLEGLRCVDGGLRLGPGSCCEAKGGGADRSEGTHAGPWA